MGKPKAPDGPNFKELMALTKEQLGATKEIFDEFMSYQRDITDTQNARADDYYTNITRPGAIEASEAASEARARYQDLAIPLQDEYIEKLTNYDTPERREQRAAEAGADVMAAGQQSLAMSRQRLMDLGVSPDTALGAGFDATARRQTALAAAGAVTNARTQSEAQGLGFAGEAANVVSGLPAQSTALMAGATNTGTSGLNATGNAGAAGTQGYATALNGMAQQGDMVNSSFATQNAIYGNDIAKYNTQIANSPLSTIAGLGGMALGGGLFAEKGGLVTEAASPSAGAIPDDVPAHLTAGEIVIPKNVVAWHGIKTFAELQKKATEAEAINTEGL